MQQKPFDRHRKDYEELVEEAIGFSGQDLDYFVEAKADLLLELARRLRGGSSRLSFLDFGCGNALLDRHLGREVGSTHGVDISLSLLRSARATAPHGRFTLFDGRHLPYAESEFDVAYASCVLHHVPPADWQEVLSEIARVLRGDGILVVIEHNPLNPLTRLAVRRCCFDEEAVLLPRARVKALLAAAGLEVVESRHTVFIPLRGPFWNRVNRRLGFLPLGGQYYVVGRKTAAESATAG